MHHKTPKRFKPILVVVKLCFGDSKGFCIKKRYFFNLTKDFLKKLMGEEKK